MRRNPLLYSDPVEIEQSPIAEKPYRPVTPTPKEPAGKSSLLFYLIILANSLLVLFVLGFIWFLFLKSPDLQIKEISNRLFGTGAPIEEAQQAIVAPEIQPEIIITPTQQEKDETQQAKLKQMRERQELAAERTRLEAIKAQIEQERIRAEEAQQAIDSLEKQAGAPSTTIQVTPSSATQSVDNASTASIDTDDQPIEIEQTRVERLNTELSNSSVASDTAISDPAVVPNAASEPATNTTQSQMDLIIEALQNDKNAADAN